MGRMIKAPTLFLCASFVFAFSGPTRGGELEEAAKKLQHGTDVSNALRGQFGDILIDHTVGRLAGRAGSAISKNFFVSGMIAGLAGDMLNPPWCSITDVFYTGDREAFQDFRDEKLTAVREQLEEHRAILAARLAQSRGLYDRIVKSINNYKLEQQSLHSLSQTNRTESLRLSEERELLRSQRAELSRKDSDLNEHPTIRQDRSNLKFYKSRFREMAPSERYPGAAREAEAYLERTGELPPEPPVPFCLNDHRCPSCRRGMNSNGCIFCITPGHCDRMSLPGMWRGVAGTHNQISRLARALRDAQGRSWSELTTRQSRLDAAESRLTESKSRESTLTQQLQSNAQIIMKDEVFLKLWMGLLADFKRMTIDPSETYIRMSDDCRLAEFVGWKSPLCEISGIGYDRSGRAPRDPQQKPSTSTPPSWLVQPKVESFSAWADAVHADRDGSEIMAREGLALPNIEPLPPGRDPLGEGPRIMSPTINRWP